MLNINAGSLRQTYKQHAQFTERLHNRYTALQLSHVCACVTGRQRLQCTDNVIMPNLYSLMVVVLNQTVS